MVIAAGARVHRHLMEYWGKSGQHVRWVELADFPTPVQPLILTPELRLPRQRQLFVKREDLASGQFGGNKLRVLELFFGKALQEGCSQVVAIGPYGSNLTIATAVHAPRVGLIPIPVVFPQPFSIAAANQLRGLLAVSSQVVAVPHAGCVPFARPILQALKIVPRVGSYWIPAGGAAPLGVLGHISAALELAEQVVSGSLPEPRHIYVGVGSNATVAGLLLGFALAVREKRGFLAMPRIVAVRVAPWPITSRVRILRLVSQTAQFLEQLSGEQKFSKLVPQAASMLSVEGRYLGRGYGQPSVFGQIAQGLWPDVLPLDESYTAKVAAGVLDAMRSADGPLLFWYTRSLVQLAPCSETRLHTAPGAVWRWLVQGGSQ